MNFKLSKAALNDLKDIWLFTFENWSIEQADRYFNLLMDEIEFLANNPTFGKNFSQVRKGYFRSRIKSHFIFYKIDPGKNEIEIIRILHQRMDLPSHLNK